MTDLDPAVQESTANLLRAIARRRIGQEVLDEAHRSIAKHGDQAHLPYGTGPDTYPLETKRGAGFLLNIVKAPRLSANATRDTKLHSHNEGGDGTITWWHIFREEVFEAAAESDPQALRTELIQVAAVAIKWVEAIDRQRLTDLGDWRETEAFRASGDVVCETCARPYHDHPRPAPEEAPSIVLACDGKPLKL